MKPPHSFVYYKLLQYTCKILMILICWVFDLFWFKILLIRTFWFSLKVGLNYLYHISCLSNICFLFINRSPMLTVWPGTRITRTCSVSLVMVYWTSRPVTFQSISKSYRWELGVSLACYLKLNIAIM